MSAPSVALPLGYLLDCQRRGVDPRAGSLADASLVALQIRQCEEQLGVGPQARALDVPAPPPGAMLHTSPLPTSIPA